MKRKSFSFTYRLTRKVVRDLKIVTDSIGLVVSGTGYFDSDSSVLDPFERYGCDIDFVIYEGKDIRPVLEITGTMEDIEEAAIKEVARVFEEKAVA